MDATIMAALIGAAASLIVTGLSTVGIEAYKHFKEGSAMAAALAGELSSYSKGLEVTKKGLTGLVATASQGQPLTIPTPEKQTDAVFDANVSRLGLLGVGVVEDLVFVYHQVRAFRQTFALATEAAPPMQGTLLEACLVVLGNAERFGAPLIARLRERSTQGFWPWAWGQWVSKRV